METLRAWALTVCFSCIAVGILQQLCAPRARFSVIKLILTLYILITAFAPLMALRYPETRMTLSLPDTPAPAQQADIDAQVLTRAEQTLADMVRTECEAAGIPTGQVRVTLTEQAEGYAVEQVHVTADAAREQEIKQAVTRALGADLRVTVEGGE